ncbi:MAG: C69 family dipeptidase [Candidatus Krumholzibacteriota bacterium]|nr:C69 family dipeptidase [Candidatus Krumholzibacteriota bacterium]
MSGKNRNLTVLLFLLAITLFYSRGVDPCTCILVGKDASIDGSVTTSHTCDSRIDRTWLEVVSGRKYGKGSVCGVYSGLRFMKFPGDTAGVVLRGEIPQARETFGYLNSSYPCMNEYQLAIGESTFGGRPELRNKEALFSCEELCRFALERARTCRDAIRVIGELAAEYGYNDGGECLMFSDKDEIWHFEIVGCGSGCIGAVWAAQRIPDDHIGVTANASRIMEIDPGDNENFIASSNIYDVAISNGWYDPDSGQSFRFSYVYDPDGRKSMAARRREWRVFDLLAPSLKLDPNSENYPISVRPDTLVSVRRLMEVFRDTFEGTEFDMTKFMYVEDEDGNFVKSPYANPFMHYDMMPLMKINGGWGKMGERCIARYYCTYITITQSRSWMPDPVGGLVWFGWDNPAMTAFVPLYCGIGDVPDSWKLSGRQAFDRDCAWWAFNRVADLSAQKWGEMRIDVDSVRVMLEDEVFAEIDELENRTIELYKKNPEKARKYLTRYSNDFAARATSAYWELGDFLWWKYTGKF